MLASEEDPLLISMHVLQVIDIDQQVEDACASGPMDAQALGEMRDEREWSDFPDWLRSFNQNSLTYQCSFCHRLDADKDGLRADLTGPWLDEHLAEVPGYDAWLFFEPGLHQWLIMHRVTLRIYISGDASVPEFVRPAARHAPGDFYDEIRDVFVESDGIERKSKQVVAVEGVARGLIKDTVGRLYGVAVDPERDVIIPQSMGNITFFVSSSALQGPERDALIAYFREAHEFAERIGDSARPLDVPEIPLYIFWGRFHTLLIDGTDDDKLIRRIMPIHFQAQLLWGYLFRTNKRIQLVEAQILAKSASGVQGEEQSLETLVNSVQYAHFLNECFRRSIEGDDDLIYRHIESRWHIDSSIDEDKDFSTYLTGYIQQALQRQSVISENRQNRILAVLAGLGVLALIDTWASFLSLFDEGYDEALRNIPLFSQLGLTSLVGVNLALSVATLVVCIVTVRSLTRR
jgi:hypothetical protein